MPPGPPSILARTRNRPSARKLRFVMLLTGVSPPGSLTEPEYKKKKEKKMKNERAGYKEHRLPLYTLSQPVKQYALSA